MESSPLHATDRRVRRRPWQRRGFKIVLGASAAALLGFLAAHLLGGRRYARLPIAGLSLATVSEGVFHDDMPLRAHVKARGTIYLDAQAGGRVERVFAHAGDMVAEGQVLIELSNSQWQLDVLEREARIVESISQLESYQTQLEQNRIANLRMGAQIGYDVVRLRRSFDRRSSLGASSLEPAEKMDQIKDELDYNLVLQPLQHESNQRQEQLREEQLPQIREQLKALQQDLRMTRDQLDKLLVRSPIVGRLTAMNAEIGENRPIGARFGEITPDQGFKLVASVDEYFLGRVHRGETAHVQIHGAEADLAVERVYPQVKNGSFDIDLAFSGDPGTGLTSGETVEGKLILGSDRPAVLLENGPFMDQTAGRWAFVLDKSSHSALRRPIALGRRNAGQLEVRGGLEPGDQVIISSYDNLMHVDQIEMTR
jgi:HlyD family secretion protein